MWWHYPQGSISPPGFVNFDSKYSKFAYSTKFGFSVAKSPKSLAHGAYDSMLAVIEEGETLFKVRCEHTVIHRDENSITSVWYPYRDVKVQTTLAACGAWHVRVHKIETDRVLQTAEGGFSIARDTFEGQKKSGKTKMLLPQFIIGA